MSKNKILLFVFVFLSFPVVFFVYNFYYGLDLDPYYATLYDSEKNLSARVEAFRFLKKQGKKNFPGLRLENLDLANFNFRSCVLTNARFRGANLQGVPFEKAELENAHLENSNLFRSWLEKANLTNANLNYANLEKAILLEANLQGAQLKGANLKEAILRHANLLQANLENTNLQGAHLQAANLQEANLQGAQMQKCRLESANLQEANLQGAQLEEVNLQQVYFREANLAGASLLNIEGQRDIIGKPYITVQQILLCKSIEGIRYLSANFLIQVKKEKPELMDWWSEDMVKELDDKAEWTGRWVSSDLD